MAEVEKNKWKHVASVSWSWKYIGEWFYASRWVLYKYSPYETFSEQSFDLFLTLYFDAFQENNLIETLPYSYNLDFSTNITRNFISFVRHHFSPTHKYKFFNAHNVKVNYSCHRQHLFHQRRNVVRASIEINVYITFYKTITVNLSRNQST